MYVVLLKRSSDCAELLYQETAISKIRDNSQAWEKSQQEEEELYSRYKSKRQSFQSMLGAIQSPLIADKNSDWIWEV